MAKTTIIGWTDHTFNIAWGCVKVSPGCKHCYADTLSKRYGFRGIWGPADTTSRRTFGEKHWAAPAAWNARAERERRRERVFSSSMCDVFEDHPTIAAERRRLWALIRQTPWLDWQLLTKRADRLAAVLPDDWGPDGYANVWLGVSIENDDYAWRADCLRSVPAVVRFISYEPALGPVAALALDRIDWVIAGGESGGGYRPMDLDWVRDLRTRCDARGISFFFKQSAAPRTEMGVTLDGEIVRFYPTPRSAARLPIPSGPR